MTNYTIAEVKLVIKTHKMDIYHKELMMFLLSIIEGKKEDDQNIPHLQT